MNLFLKRSNRSRRRRAGGRGSGTNSVCFHSTIRFGKACDHHKLKIGEPLRIPAKGYRCYTSTAMKPLHLALLILLLATCVSLAQTPAPDMTIVKAARLLDVKTGKY